MWHLLGRQLSGKGAFKGGIKAVSVENPAGWLELEHGFDLWYFKFAKSSEVKGYKKRELVGYYGVYDIDIKKDDPRSRLVLEATKARQAHSLREILAEELELVKKTLTGVPYKVYASGSRGLHVYSADPKMFVKVAKGSEMAAPFHEQFLRSKLSVDFVSRLDLSIYPVGCGIRPFSCEHPVTHVMPFLVYESGEFSLEDFLMEQLPVAEPSISIVLPQSAVTLETITPISTPRKNPLSISVTDSADLLSYVQKESGLASITVVRETKGTRYLSGHWCPIKKGFHDSNSNCTFWYRSSNDVWVCQCYAAGCTKKRFFLRKPTEPVTMPKDKRISSGSVETLEIEGKYLPTDKIIPLWKETKREVLCSSMGTGKTTLFHAYLEQLDREAAELRQPRRPVLIIGTRRSQCKCWFNKFSDLGFTDYDAETGSLAGFDRLIVCLNSINRLVDKSKLEIRPGTILLIDEVVAFCRWLGSPLLGNKSSHASQPYIFEVVKLLFSKSDQVICMDGLPDKIVSYYLDLIGELPRFHWTVNTSISDDKLWKIYHHTVLFHETLCAAVKGPNKVALVCNIKSHIHLYTEYFCSVLGLDKNQMLAITGDIPESLRNDAGNPNSCWSRYKIVFYNNSLGPGASYDFPDQFEVFGVASAESGFDPVLALQLFSRVRSPINNCVHVLMLHKSESESHQHISSGELLKNMCLTISTYTQNAIPIVTEYLEANYNRSEYARDPSVIRTVPEYDPVSNQMVEALAPCTQTFILRYEPNPLLKLMAKIRAGAHNATISSAVFLEKLTDLITRSGGLIKYVGTPPQTKKEKSFHHCYFKHVVKAGEFKAVHGVQESFIFAPSEKLSLDQNNMIREKLSVDKPGIQYSFKLLYEVLIKEEELEPASKYIGQDATRLFVVPDVSAETSVNNVNPVRMPRATLNHHNGLGELLPLTRELLALSNMQVREGQFIGELETAVFIKEPERQKAMEKVMHDLAWLRHRTDQTFCPRKLVTKIQERHQYLVDALKDMFKWLGFALEQTDKIRVRSPEDKKKRVVAYKLVPDQLAFDAKLASLGITKCGEKRTRQEAFELLFN